MGWLKLSFGKGGAAVAERETAESGPEVPSGPPLIVLVNDASGRASFKEYVFHDVEAATDWVSYWFRHRNEDGMIAFWALPDQPETDLAEPLVIIRDLDRHGVVYMFSFANLTAAEGFISQEAEHGTGADSMVLYWAVPVKREFDQFGKIFLTPSTPPGSADYDSLLNAGVDRRVERQEPPALDSAKEASSAALEEASNARTGVAEPTGGAEETFELTDWVHRGRERGSDRLATEPEPIDKFVDRDDRVRSIEPVMREITSLLEEALEEADDRVESDTLVSDDASGEAAKLTPINETFAEELTMEAPSTSLSGPIEAELVIEPFGGPLEDEAVTAVENATLVEPGEAEAVNMAGETPAEPRDDEFGTADEPYVPDHDLPEHEVAPQSVNGNGHVPEVTTSLWERAEEIAENVQLNGIQNGASPDEVKYATKELISWDATEKIDRGADTHENGASSEETSKRIKEVLVNVNVNVNLNDPTDSETTTNVSIVSRALKIKRWEVRDEPFEGFNSPPGRF